MQASEFVCPPDVKASLIEMAILVAYKLQDQKEIALQKAVSALKAEDVTLRRISKDSLGGR